MPPLKEIVSAQDATSRTFLFRFDCPWEGDPKGGIIKSKGYMEGNLSREQRSGTLESKHTMYPLHPPRMPHTLRDLAFSPCSSILPHGRSR